MFKKLLMSAILFSLVLMFGCREKLNLTDPGPGTNLLITENSTPNTFYLLAPKGGDNFPKGIQMRIGWYASPSVKTIGLSLFRKTEEIAGITVATDNDGQFFWRIPTNIPASDHYRIKLTNTLIPEEFIFSDYFKITAPSDSTQ